ncbi:unnamed protein product, partial [Heterosigma akashiwo]
GLGGGQASRRQRGGCAREPRGPWARLATELAARSLLDWPLQAARNFLVGPLTEEFVFRGCMCPLLLCAGVPLPRVVFLGPLVFGVAHLHHASGGPGRGARSPCPAGRRVPVIIHITVWGLCRVCVSSNWPTLGCILVPCILQLHGVTGCFIFFYLQACSTFCLVPLSICVFGHLPGWNRAFWWASVQADGTKLLSQFIILGILPKKLKPQKKKKKRL